MAQPVKTAAERIATELLEDEPTQAHLMLTNLIHTAAYLNAKAQWSMEDNFNTTEAICSDFGALIPDDQLIGIVGESGFHLSPEDVEERLRPYLPTPDPEED
ncbi:hypothetical protein [Micrococcus luteus]|uniref:hypothetical protein n=1 Tax=Micrococcus luteus TaxID=1270 RepID=UPI0006684B8C|nr:hypothetical protein [Micrococcus luteus]MBN6750210.1 hypothetical protein [Micrococcus luteus]MBN6761119.1 hypothetical protein [Micrococcus luteus]MBN6801809.1 hypothetical protein [Micrococcus luteus]TKD49112.1 hypothetical protein FBF74_12135 [Micrococcus luteus]